MNMPETSNAENRPTASAGMSWPAIFAAINVIALILGFVYWQNNSLREDTRHSITNLRVLIVEGIKAIDGIIVKQNPESSSAEWDREMSEEIQ